MGKTTLEETTKEETTKTVKNFLIKVIEIVETTDLMKGPLMKGRQETWRRAKIKKELEEFCK